MNEEPRLGPVVQADPTKGSDFERRIAHRVKEIHEHEKRADVIRLSAGTWIKIFAALAVHAGAIISWGISIEKRMALSEANQQTSAQVQERMLNLLYKLEDRVYEQRKP